MAASKKYQFTNLQLFAENPKGSFIFHQMTSFNNLVLPPQVALDFAKNFKQLRSLHEDYKEIKKKIIDERVEKNENGAPVIRENKYQFPTPEKEKEVIALLEELDAATVEVELIPLKMTSIRKVEGVTGHMLSAFLEFVDESEEG